MAGHRKRKHAAVNDLQSKQTQRDITAIGTVRKFDDGNGNLKKRKVSNQREATPPAPLVSRAVAQSQRNKRKRERELDAVAEEDADEELSRHPQAHNGIFKRSVKQWEVLTPHGKRSKIIDPPSPAQTPSKSTAALFTQLKLDNNTAQTIPFALGQDQRPPDTPPDSPEAHATFTGALPAELIDLLQLHAAFLSALSLYYAHNGVSSTVNVKAFLPMITKSWKKRSVTLNDLRTLLAVDPANTSNFVIQDHGRAGVCLSKPQPRGRATIRAASFIDEVDLNARFEDALQTEWVKWQATTAKENRHVAVFVNQLPLAEIAKVQSVEKIAPLFARGQQRLADLKASQAATQPETAVPSQLVPEQRTNPAVHNRGTSLLDRILAKQTLTASLPAGPTKEQLERKAALHRIEEIARVLELLAAGRPRCSFSVQAVVQQLQQSLRNPIGKQEVRKCLDLMAKEIMPGFVNLVQTGSLTGVVVMRGGKVGSEELKQRVLDARA